MRGRSDHPNHYSLRKGEPSFTENGGSISVTRSMEKKPRGSDIRYLIRTQPTVLTAHRPFGNTTVLVHTIYTLFSYHNGRYSYGRFGAITLNRYTLPDALTYPAAYIYRSWRTRICLVTPTITVFFLAMSQPPRIHIDKPPVEYQEGENFLSST